MADMFVLVAYDSPDDRRRAKLHDRLLDYGSPVQYSVFECQVDAKRLQEMKRMIHRTISRKRDHVRVYRLCAGCVAKTWVTGGQEILSEPPPAVVV